MPRTSKPTMLDGFCGAGGATRGYQLAGFHVTGVDIVPQPNYCGDEFIQGDAVAFIRDHGHKFDAIHASPPCQGYSYMSNCRPGLADEYPKLIEPVMTELRRIGKPWVVENVEGSGLTIGSDLFGSHGMRLCGAMFGLNLYRHRLFETSYPSSAPFHPRHVVPASRAGHWRPGTVISVAGNCSPIALARSVMGIDWTTRAELAESIPPAYTEYVGHQLRSVLAEVAA